MEEPEGITWSDACNVRKRGGWGCISGSQSNAPTSDLGKLICFQFL